MDLENGAYRWKNPGYAPGHFVLSINKETEGLNRAATAILKAIVAVRLFGEFSD